MMTSPSAGSLSPALEGDLAAFGPAPHFAGTVERVGEVEQGGPALPFAVGDQRGAAFAQSRAVQLRIGPGGEMIYEVPGVVSPAQVLALRRFHMNKLRASVAERQCNAVPVSHPMFSPAEIVR